MFTLGFAATGSALRRRRVGVAGSHAGDLRLQTRAFEPLRQGRRHASKKGERSRAPGDQGSGVGGFPGNDHQILRVTAQ
jgi:hypothetical protein